MDLLKNRVGLVVGVANARSLATGIARAASEAGACLVFTAQNSRLQPKVAEIAAALEQAPPLVCDLTQEAQLAALMQHVQRVHGRLDFVVHAVAAARRQELRGRFVDSTPEGFAEAMQVSVYTLVSLARHAEPLLRAGIHPSLLTLSYYGAQRAMPNYNVMGVAKAALESAVRYLACDLGPQGIRVNALSPGPCRTLSAAAIDGLRDGLAAAAAQAPLRRNVDAAEVGAAALGLLSALGRGITGEVVFVDAGFHAAGAPP
jgi:enoyl-[acyl-carrier protein] reductase I